jgi:hypothetical protein
MEKTYETGISGIWRGLHKSCRKNGWKFTTAHLLSLVALTAGLVMLPLVARATDRLNDSEVDQLLSTIETDRAAFEASLDTKLKNAVIKGPRGEVNTNEFFDDVQDQVTRTKERFHSDYSASSEVIALLGYGTRLDRWSASQATSYKGSTEWNTLSSDFKRLAAAYNTTFPTPENGMARRYNDADLKTAVANVEKYCDPFRSELEASLTANKTVTPETRQSTLQQVDTLKSYASALGKSLESGQKGITEADALIKQGLIVAAWVAKNQVSAATSSAWTPLRGELGKVAWGYEVNSKTLMIQ